MKKSRAAKRYAKSLLDLANEQQVSEETTKGMLAVAETCLGNQELKALLSNPTIKPRKKKDILASVFSKKTNKLTLSFIKLIAQKGRADILGAIASSFVSAYKEQKGISIITITTATPMSDVFKSELLGVLGNTKTEIIEKTDPSIIGGFVFRKGDNQYDASVVRQLNNLKQKYESNHYIKEL